MLKQSHYTVGLQSLSW